MSMEWHVVCQKHVDQALDEEIEKPGIVKCI